MKKTLFTFPIEVVKAIKDFAEKRSVEIQKKIRSLSREDPFADSDRLIDNAASDTEVKEQIDHERNEAIKNELLKQLAEINAAIKRIDSHQYGFCEHCGKLIPTERLEVNPFARLCVNCEKKKEK